MALSLDEIDSLFALHEVTPETRHKYEAIRMAAREFARVVHANTPRCADQTAAIRKIREAASLSYDAVTLNGKI